MSKDHRKQRSRAILIALFFASGFTGLTYEILWQKQFIVHLGAAAPSVAAVLAAFFAGIAFGGEFGDVLLSHSRRPALALYAGAEFVIAANAFLMPWIQSDLFALYISTARHADPTGVAMYVFRFFLCCVGVLPATLAMGATIPLMAAALKNENGVARAYGVNAAGGMTAASLTPFGLLPLLGIRAATVATVAVHAAVITVA